MNKLLLRQLAFVFFLASLPNNLYAQAWEYFKHAGGGNWDMAYDMVSDNQGNLYMTGYFTDSLMFGNTKIKTERNEDVFIAKYDSDGNLIWVRAGGGPGFDYGYGISLDNQGNSYVTGMVQGNVTFDHVTVNRTSQDIFIAKYNSDGMLQWLEFAGGSNNDISYGIATDPNGNSYITGSTGGGSAFGTKMLSPAGTFVAKYNSSGKIAWVKKYGGGGQEKGNKIVLDKSGHFFLTGEYNNTAFFGTTSLSSISGSTDVFCAKADTSGNIMWVTSGGGDKWDNSGGIDIDQEGNVYCAGSFQSVGTFGTQTLTAGSYYSIFIAKYNSNGNFVWAKKAGASCCDYANDIAVSQQGDIFITGQYSYPGLFGSIILDGSSFYVYSNGNSYVAKYDASGNALWATSGGPFPNNQGTFNTSDAVTVDNKGYVYYAGAFTGNFIYGADQDTVIVNTVRDIYLAKIKDEDFIPTSTVTYNGGNKNFLLYPNPNQGSFAIKSFDSDDFNFEIVDMLGNIIKNDFSQSGIIEINGLSSGLYFLRIRKVDRDEIFSAKFIVE